MRKHTVGDESATQTQRKASPKRFPLPCLPLILPLSDPTPCLCSLHDSDLGAFVPSSPFVELHYRREEKSDMKKPLLPDDVK